LRGVNLREMNALIVGRSITGKAAFV
jgi:hypothetical protein